MGTIGQCNTQALKTMYGHHEELVSGVLQRTSRVLENLQSPTSFGEGLGELVFYIEREVLNHAKAEEETIYVLAKTQLALAAIIDEMIQEHEKISVLTRSLKEVPSGPKWIVYALELNSLFASHVTKENVVVLPALVRDSSIDLAQLLHEMHGNFEERLSNFENKDQSKDNKGKAADKQVVDVRTIAPRSRHELIFSTFCELEPGESFVLVNDHDPKPLRYQFQAEYTESFSWDYLESGPSTWRVKIRRTN